MVAIFNASEDIMVELFLTLKTPDSEPTHVLSLNGEIDIVSFTEQHDPDVIVYDIPPPYQQSWNILKQFRNLAVK